MRLYVRDRTCEQAIPIALSFLEEEAEPWARDQRNQLASKVANPAYQLPVHLEGTMEDFYAALENYF
jgi:predicted lipoprotein